MSKISRNYDIDDLPPILTVSDISEILRISRSLSYELVKSKNFPKIVINRTIRVSRDKFTRWLDNQQHEELDPG